MPIINVSIRSGRDQEQLNDLMRALHDATKEVLGTADSNIRVLLHEIEGEHWMSGRVTLAEMSRAKADPTR